MNTHVNDLQSHLENATLLTDGGLETDLIFNKGIELPCFASFDLLSTEWGQQVLREYYQGYLDLAGQHRCGFILETPTWRANPDWGKQLGYTTAEIVAINRKAVDFARELCTKHRDSTHLPAFISGNLGPRGDGYVADTRMSAEQSRAYHDLQIAALAEAGADLISAFTLNYADEALGIAAAAADHGIAVVISFTVETDGRLPSGQPLGDAITEIDRATDSYPLYYMINCAHPTHFEKTLSGAGSWRCRIGGIRSNASKCSHAELDEAEVLDEGNPTELGEDYRRLQSLLPGLRVYGGCCGTDLRHVTSIAEACIGPVNHARTALA